MLHSTMMPGYKHAGKVCLPPSLCRNNFGTKTIKQLLIPAVLMCAAIAVLVLNQQTGNQLTAAYLPKISTDEKIPVDPKRWCILNYAPKGIETLFNGITDESIQTGYGAFRQHYECIYPLEDGESISISQVKMFDGPGDFSDAPARLYAIKKDGQKILLATFSGKVYNEWTGPSSSLKTKDSNPFKLDSTVTDIRYLLIQCTRNNLPTEIEFYGDYKAPYAKSENSNISNAPFSNTIGTNGFEWDFVKPKENATIIAEDKYAAIHNFKGFRQYLDWSRMEDKEGDYTFSPCHYGGWDYDMTYRRCKHDSIEVLVCIKNIPDWLMKTYPEGQQNVDNVPAKYGLPRNNPASYIEKAKMAFQFAARYGSNLSIPANLIKTDIKQRWNGDIVNKPATGLNLVKYIECGNELDKWWKGANGCMDCFEYASLLSAFYDGNKGTMGKDAGVKNADANMQVVMGGLAMPNAQYVRGMIEWCRQNRGYKADGSIDLCWDVINYHYYSNNSGAVSANEVTGIAPEAGNAAAVAKSFVQLSANYAHHMPVWITELGYDLNEGSTQRAIAIGNRSAVETQADWTLRSALLYLRAGIERTFFYELKDFNINNTTKYASMGLTDSLHQRKPALDFLYQTNLLMGNFHFAKNLGHLPEIDVYERGDEKIYAVWMPTQEGLSKNCSIAVGNAMSAVVYQPHAGFDNMLTKRVEVNSGLVNITATETPVFVRVVK